VQQQEKTYTIIANVIRGRSRAGQLVQLEDVLAELTGHGLATGEGDDPRSGFQAIIEEAIARHEDLRGIPGGHGLFYYYSTRGLSETYAKILARREGNLLELIAEVVRDNSKIYPRPVSLDIFKASPFDLSQAEILQCLETMGEQADYKDIVHTTTSIGTKYLFSTQHLDPHYASTLAEWIDVGQANNP
jgi:hypothetical protein